MLLSRTAAAFRFTADRLARESKELYFWTWTFKKVPINDEYAMMDFAAFRLRLYHHFPFLRGVRVCELHRSHGIHFHAVVNDRIPIDRMKRIMRGSGRLNGDNRYLDFGRMSVTKCDAGTIGYLAKYLTKQYRKQHNFAGRRRWGTMGGLQPIRCRDILYSTPFHRNMEDIFMGRKTDYVTMLLVSHYSTMWGSVTEWPAHLKLQVMNFNTQRRIGEKGISERYIPENERQDPAAIAYRGHLEMCGTCRCGYGHCSRGWDLWQQFIWYPGWREQMGFVQESDPF